MPLLLARIRIAKKGEERCMNRYNLNWRALVGIALGLLFFEGCPKVKMLVGNKELLPSTRRIAVLPFISDKKALGANVASSLAAEMLGSCVSIVERAQLDQILREQGLSVKDIIANHSIVIGKIRGIDALVVGEVVLSTASVGGILFGHDVDFISSATARILDVRTGEILAAIVYSEKKPDTDRVSTPSEVGKKLANKLKKLLCKQ